MHHILLTCQNHHRLAVLTQHLWKYLLIVTVLALGVIYALPNLYPDDPAIQISGASSTQVIDQADLDRIEQALDGRPTIIVVDEGWKALDDPVFTQRLKDWEKTLRKRNGVVGFCTQSASDALESRIAAAIVEQAATQAGYPVGALKLELANSRDSFFSCKATSTRETSDAPQPDQR